MVNTDVHFEKLLHHFQQIISISAADFESILNNFSIRWYKKKEYLLHPPAVCRHETYIVQGLFQTAIIDDAGKAHSLYFPHEDWWVSDFKSFKTGKPSCMEIQALEDSIVLQISKPSLEKLYEDFPVFERFFRILNENAGMALQDRIFQNFSQSAERKYKEFQKKYPALRQRLAQKRIASFLGVTPEYFSQMLKG